MIMTCGSSAIAIAIMTRWRMPPESSCGYDFSRERSTPTRSSSSPQLRTRSLRDIPGRWVVKTSSSCAWMLITGLSEFIAPWNTMEILSPRKARNCSAAERGQIDGVALARVEQRVPRGDQRPAA